MLQPDYPSITTFRALMSAALAGELEGSRRDVIVLAVDGVPVDLAVDLWPNATVTTLQSVFPTTSSTAWLSSLSGLDVAQHGVPGVVFTCGDEGLINVFEYAGALDAGVEGNVFSDADAVGYCPMSIVGDWEPYACSWRAMLLRHAETVFGYRFYTGPYATDAAYLCAHVREALSACRAGHDGRPRFVWCFIDLDRRVHRRGYDEGFAQFMSGVDRLAMDLVRDGARVFAHSDHGLTPTNNNEDVERLMHEVRMEFGATLGGAGRTRWIYAPAGTESKVVARLECRLPESVRIDSADRFFPPGTLARSRVGQIVLVAESADFLAFAGHSFDHGSCTARERYVPFAEWVRT